MWWGGPRSPPLSRCPLPRHCMVLFPPVLYYPYTGKVHIHLMDLDAPVRVTLRLASSQHVPDAVLEEQGSGILQLNWPRFSNVSHAPAAGPRALGRGVHPPTLCQSRAGATRRGYGSVLGGQRPS